jgi:hypothetical protein
LLQVLQVQLAAVIQMLRPPFSSMSGIVKRCAIAGYS